MEELERRIEELETRFAFQEDLLESLNRQVAEQGLLFDELVKRYRKLQEQLEQVESPQQGQGMENEPPPPHY